MAASSIATLPNDLIYAVLHCAAASLRPRLVNGRRPRLELLVRASLVCRAWREPAQALLSQSISVTRTEVERWVNAPAANGVRPTAVEITLTGLDRSKVEMDVLVRGAMAKCAGVRELILSGSGAQMDFLEMDELADLTRLTLDFTFPTPDRLLSSYRFPFQLSSLCPGAISRSSALLPLLTCSAHSLTHLDITSLFIVSGHNTPFGTLVEHFHLVAGTLSRLSLRLWRDDVANLALLLDQANALDALECSVHSGSQEDLKVVLEMVRTRLKSLKLARWPGQAWAILEEALGCKALERLGELHVCTYHAQDSEELRGLVEECGRRGIKLSIEAL